ncbi:class I SAM-dependent methyltransferase [Anaerovorax odorimutans]|uniref:Class I SAM-dependent methyltransferase n=1 Tax=Anaerovorax odorimutans TaxID=109327 RepID=A0ABT1RLK0_9FIRM|nr:class I SAM-dependent methyltransferase [Anaerovorax odorimutans]MCQ4636063.1 class I SAM-dependent methyltransferase [Anaerovorax odorimutans]
MTDDKTIEYYDKNAKTFFDETCSSNMSHLYDSFLKYIPKNGTILDLGCGSGRDSKAFLDRGYQVTAVDASQQLCCLASAFIGQEVLCRKFEDLNFCDSFDGIWACASLLHVNKEDMPRILRKLSLALKREGVLYASFKYGDSQRTKGLRFFNDYTEADLDSLLCPETGFCCVEWSITGDVREGREGEKWLNFVARKWRK